MFLSKHLTFVVASYQVQEYLLFIYATTGGVYSFRPSWMAKLVNVHLDVDIQLIVEFMCGSAL